MRRLHYVELYLICRALSNQCRITCSANTVITWTIGHLLLPVLRDEFSHIDHTHL